MVIVGTGVCQRLAYLRNYFLAIRNALGLRCRTLLCGKRPGKFLLKIKRPHVARFTLVPSGKRPGKFLLKSEILCQGTGNVSPIFFSQSGHYFLIGQLQSWHARHDYVAPAKDIFRRIKEIWPRNGYACFFVQLLCEELFGRKLPGKMRPSTQHKLTLCTGKEDILSK